MDVSVSFPFSFTVRDPKFDKRPYSMQNPSQLKEYKMGLSTSVTTVKSQSIENYNEIFWDNLTPPQKISILKAFYPKYIYKSPDNRLNVSGVVTTLDTPTPNTYISLMSCSYFKLKSTYTDSNGNYTFFDVPTGFTYSLIAKDSLLKYNDTLISQVVLK